MAETKSFSNVIIGQFALTGVPVKVYASGRFLSITDTDDVEDPLMGFGMDENGDMIQFSYPEVEFLQVSGNKIDIETYNKGMAALHKGDSAPADKTTEEEPADDEKESEEEKPESDAFGPKESFSKLGDLIKEGEMEKRKIARLKKDIIDLKQKDLEDQEKTLSKMDDGIVMEDHYTFGTGDIVNNKNTNCTHYGSKGIVIQIPQQGYVRYTVTNSGDTYKPGDILTKTADQLEKI